MTDLELMNAGELHHCEDKEIHKSISVAQAIIEKYNSVAYDDDNTRNELLKELLGKVGNRCTIKPPFHCDYGKFIEIGDYSFLNYDCIILDACKVKIGNHVLIGPRTCIYSVAHPIDPLVRIQGYDISKPVTICDNVWLGGNVVVNPGVTIGEGSVIGSGSVITKDIPPNVIAAGNPCRVIREITEEDKRYWEEKRDNYLKAKSTL